MSTLPENEFDLEKLFLPAWAQQESSSAKYAKFEGEDERPGRRGDRRGGRLPRREGGVEGRPERGPRREHRPAPAGPQEAQSAFPGRRGHGPRTQRDARPRRGDFPLRREPPPPLVEVSVTFVPEDKGVELLARQIKMTGRAYPLFEIAQMILQRPERHVVVFSVKKNAEGRPIQPLYVCALDETLWTSEEDAAAHALKRHFNTFYQAEKTATEPPKGKYTFVAQCGLSGVILGPPNYHHYQDQLRKLHAERFSRMPFEAYKSRVKIVRDEEVVKKWVEEQSWRTEYVCLNMPEPLRLGDMDAVEKHFRENHQANIVKQVESHTLSGTAARALRSPELARLVRSAWEEQRRFPLQIATVLSQQFASHGLQFFKVNRTITHVSVARPHYLDLAMTPVSRGVQQIVEFINATPKCTRRQLLGALAPRPAAAPPSAAHTEEPAPTATPDQTQPTSEETAVIADLHWLIHQGHVIEFANGVLETAKKPAPRPPKKEPTAQKPTEAATPGETITGEDSAPPVLTPQPVAGAEGETFSPGDGNVPGAAPAHVELEQSLSTVEGAGLPDKPPGAEQTPSTPPPNSAEPAPAETKEPRTDACAIEPADAAAEAKPAETPTEPAPIP